MRLVERTAPGQLGVNYIWLPTWIGMNSALVKEMDSALAEKLVGKELTEETLEEAHDVALSFLEQRFPNIPGLFDYLDGLKFVIPNVEAQNPQKE